MEINWEMLQSVAAAAADTAYANYSGFRVGAALLTSDGTVFSGCNIENASYGLTICAERVALFKSVSSGYRSFSALMIVCDSEIFPYPCGACRQVLAEFCKPEMLVRMVALKTGKFQDTKLGELLPFSFTLA